MKRIRDATVMLGMLERGEVAGELNRVLMETLAALKGQSVERPKSKIKGNVALKLDLVVEGGAVSITADIAAKTPKPVRGSSFFWVTDDGELTTEHPQQQDMFAGPREAENA